MTKRIAFIAVLLLVAHAYVPAQSMYQLGMESVGRKSKVEQTFNTNENLITLKDFVTLKTGRLILELSNVFDFDNFRNMDSLLRDFKKDIAFYADSLAANPTSNVRIDYVLNENYSSKKIRFKKYPSDGNIFANSDGKISKLKFGQDTVRILFQKSKPGFAKRPTSKCSIPYSIQATFILGNYTDIDKLLEEKVLNGIVDTLQKMSQSSKSRSEFYSKPLTITYNPYFAGNNSLKKFYMVSGNEYDIYTPSNSTRNLFTINADLGFGLVENLIAPCAEINAMYIQKSYWHNNKDYDFYKLSVTPYFLFDRDPNHNLVVNDNWFLNFTIGSVYEGNQYSWLGKKVSLGVGYLIQHRGDYFPNSTYKIFSDIEITKRLNISPELIFTDNARLAFPGFTIKVM
jgi:hypothetical protein